MICNFCKKEFVQTRANNIYCSKKCKNSAKHEKSLVKVICVDCGIEFFREKWDLEQYTKICWNCKCRRQMLKQNISGEKNHRWRGGCESWEKGRWGKDRNGLSWKTQRKLAWERDKYICQICGKKYESRKPDVHHIIPYRDSRSHSLDNLICLCKKCHTKEDAKIKAGLV